MPLRINTLQLINALLILGKTLKIGKKGYIYETGSQLQTLKL